MMKRLDSLLILDGIVSLSSSCGSVSKTGYVALFARTKVHSGVIKTDLDINKNKVEASSFTDFDLTGASIHDIHYLKDIKQLYNNSTIFGNKGCLSIDYQRKLFSSNQIKFEVPMRKNQYGYKP